MRKSILLMTLSILLLASLSPLLTQPTESYGSTAIDDDSRSVERVSIPAVADAISDIEHSQLLLGVEISRQSNADTHLGMWTTSGLSSNMDIPTQLRLPRNDIALAIVDGDVGLWDARSSLSEVSGLEVRAHIPPSGFLLQGSAQSLEAARGAEGVLSVHAVPLAFMLDSELIEMYIDAQSVVSSGLAEGGEPVTSVRMHGWRLAETAMPLDHLSLSGYNFDLDARADELLIDHRDIDNGRHDGLLRLVDLPAAAASPSLSWLSLEPVWMPHNNEAFENIHADDVENFFLTGLNGSGQLVAVADSGIDRDHGDFGQRIQHVESVTWGDSSTEDTHSGHGTHVACTVLGDGFRGAYAGIAPQAELWFQAMEDDSTGDFSGASMDYMLRTAYEGGAHIHTNSWGAHQNYGEYTSSSEDVDSRTSQYDQYWSYDGLVVLASAGNDGPDSDTVSPPATAKNVIAVANTHNRGGGAPDTLSQSSSRGPTDDGRIKPDVSAPGAWVRSCRSQDATETSGASWSSQWYLEYSGTSMAAPNAAGAATLIREYLTEVAGRPSPQGALIKAMLILGAEDIGSRNIPNNDEGWGLINLANSLLPGSDTGVWVADRYYVRSGNTEEFLFNVSRSNTPFKVVLAWSDYQGNSWASKQLQNDLDLVVIAPDGTEYLGNDFSSGRSTTGGTRDSTNNVEVTLVDNADMGIWTVRVTDVSHGGQRSEQSFAVAVRGAGVNDLRSDPLPLAETFTLSTEIPQVNDVTTISIQIQNQGGGPANGLPVQAIAGGQNLGEVTLELGPGMIRWATWDWTPITEGEQAITIRVDPYDVVSEIDEANNLFQTTVAVSAPGVRISTDETTKRLVDPSTTSTSWDFVLKNTALLPTNASVSATKPVFLTTGQEMTSWFTSFNLTTFQLNGSEESRVGFTLVHSSPTSPPSPGYYQFTVTAMDVDNNVAFPLTLTLDVPVLPDVSFQMPFTTLSVSPVYPTEFTVEILNDGNGMQGYNLYLDGPVGWRLGLDELGTTEGASSGSTGSIPVSGTRAVAMTLYPPAYPASAGQSLVSQMRVISQMDPDSQWVLEIPMEVSLHEQIEMEIDIEYGVLRPDSVLTLQYSITNIGNADMTLHPDLNDRPGGWDVTAGSGSFTVPVGESRAYLINLEGNGYAVGGEMNFHLSTINGYRYTWHGSMEVTAPPQPSLSFWSVRIGDGEEAIGDPYGAGEHPPGAPGVTFSWLIGNTGSEPWTPSVDLEHPVGLDWFKACDIPGEVIPDESVIVACSLFIPPDTVAGSQPEITFTMNIDGLLLSDTLTLYVAANPIVVWRPLSLDEFTEGKQGEVMLSIENIGNTQISEMVVIDAPEDWKAEVDGSPALTLNIGETRNVRLLITPADVGEHSLLVSIGEDGDIADAVHSITVNVNRDVNSNSGSGSALTVAAFILFVLVIVGAVLSVLLFIPRKQETSPSKNMAAATMPPPLNAPAALATSTTSTTSTTTTSSATSAAPATVASAAEKKQATAPAVICWGCNKNITGPRRACPSCGARYHAEISDCAGDKLDECKNCGDSADEFVDEEGEGD